MPYCDNKYTAIYISGLITGFFNWLPGIPFDPIKTNMQNNLNETTMRQVASQGYKTEGLKYFFKGGNLILFRGTIHSGILF